MFYILDPLILDLMLFFMFLSCILFAFLSHRNQIQVTLEKLKIMSRS